MLRFIFVKEGLGGLYAGLAPTLVMSVPNTVLYFTTYDELYARLVQRWRKSCNHTITTSSSATPPPDWIPLVSGSSARLVATLATAPLELVRTRQAMWQQSSSSSWRHELQHLIQTQGITSVFVGVRPTLYRDVPFSAIYWLCLERFRRSWKIYNEKRTVSTLQHFGQAFVNGAVSGMIASACTTPLDVVKTRIQTMTATNTIKKEVVQVCHHHYARGHKTTPIPSSTLQLLRDILRQEGVAGLWRGNTTRMLKVAPACAIMISCYEVTKLVVEESTT
jgi:solute carrier family 25 protein 39/40